MGIRSLKTRSEPVMERTWAGAILVSFGTRGAQCAETRGANEILPSDPYSRTAVREVFGHSRFNQQDTPSRRRRSLTG